MSIATISYSSLRKASGEAKDVAKKLDKYADSLYDDVYKKLNKYDGGWSSNLSTASSKVNSKISELQNESRKYNEYATDLTDLHQECKSVDKAVRSRISSLTASFKERNGIRNDWLENSVNYFLTSVKNKTSAGRFLGSKKDEWDSAVNYLKSSIKDWYNYQGGKQYIKGKIDTFLDIAGAVLSVVLAVTGFLAATLVTPWAVIVLAAGFLGAAISMQNAWSNAKNENAAYLARQNGDPATGYRRSKLDKYSDYLRSSYKFGDDGQTYKYVKRYNYVAKGLDVAKIVCDLIDLGDGLYNFAKSGYKWASGKTDFDGGLKTIFSKDGLDVFKNKFGELGKTLKADAFGTLKNWGKLAFENLGPNIKKQFWDFFDINGNVDVLSGLKSTKNMISVAGDLNEGGLNLKNIVKTGVNKVVLPSTIAFEFAKDPELIIGKGGQIQFDFTDHVSLGDIKGLFKGGFGLGEGTVELFSSEGLSNKIINKLSKPSGVDISIPEINVPQINIPVMPAA